MAAAKDWPGFTCERCQDFEPEPYDFDEADRLAAGAILLWQAVQEQGALEGVQ